VLWKGGKRTRALLAVLLVWGLSPHSYQDSMMDKVKCFKACQWTVSLS